MATVTVDATLVFTAFAVLLFGSVLTFAAIVDRRRVRRIEQNAPERADQPPAARLRWLRRGR